MLCTTVPPPHAHTHHCWKMVAHSCMVHTLWSGRVPVLWTLSKRERQDKKNDGSVVGEPQTVFFMWSVSGRELRWRGEGGVFNVSHEQLR